LPGSGKSTLARSITQAGDFEVLRSDVIRKELAGVTEVQSASFGEGIYSDKWSDRTYAELLRRTEQALWLGKRVVIDANLRENRRRRPYFDAAMRWGVRVVFVQCAATPEITRARLQARKHDVSDADWDIYLHLQSTWEPLDVAWGVAWRQQGHALDTSGAIAESTMQLQAILRQEGLLD
jgi:predicted kinase